MSTSISKGCFVSKPRGKNIKSNLFFENDQTILYEQITKNIETSLLSIHKDIQTNLFDELLSFVEKTHDRNRISTALLMLGVNVSDHSLFFKQLSNHLTLVTSMVAVVSSKSCTSIKSMIQNIIIQLIDSQSEIIGESSRGSDVDSDDEDTDVYLKRTQYDFLNFQDYYHDSSCKSKLIIILQDYESFPNTILNEFLLILHEYIVSLPFVLICGISTSPSIIHSSLNYDVISTMKIHTFYNQPSIECLNLISDRIILNNKFPVVLHHTIVEFLIDNFLFYDFSLNTFMKGIKICILKHINMNSINMLCHKIMSQTLSKDMINTSMLADIKKLESIAKLNIKKLDASSVVSFALDLFQHTTNMFTALQCLFTLVRDLPNNPLGKQLRDIYCIVLSENSFVDSPTFKQCLQLFQFISKQELLGKISTIINIVSQNQYLQSELNELKKLEKEIAHADTEVQIKQNNAASKILTPKSRAQLKQNLLENIKQDKLQYEFDIKREKLVQYLIYSLMKKYLIPLQNLPLHEIVLFKDCHLLKRYLAGAPRAAIHTALNNPNYYLQCDCCKVNDPGEILPSMPDVCLAYKLHLESATMINMHDWLQSFATIVNPDGKLSETAVKARFTQAVSELQFLGFIKNCKQKIDHVSRLTWGDS